MQTQSVICRLRPNTQINVYIERTTLERLNKFCEEIGGNKSVTTDKAINRYIDEMEKKLKK